MTRGKLELRRERLDVAELLRGEASECRASTPSGGATIDLELPEEPVWVLGDAPRLSQVIGHLIDNAVKFSPRNCRVWITLRMADGERPQATILVIDHGIGMDAPTLQSAFEPFAQGTQTDDRDRRGLGLGLALAKAIVELHGGQITAQSEGPGHGTSVSISLPIEGPAPQECERCAGRPPGPLPDRGHRRPP